MRVKIVKKVGGNKKHGEERKEGRKRGARGMGGVRNERRGGGKKVGRSVGNE